jgi:hypothetical protein
MCGRARGEKQDWYDFPPEDTSGLNSASAKKQSTFSDAPGFRAGCPVENKNSLRID